MTVAVPAAGVGHRDRRDRGRTTFAVVGARYPHLIVIGAQKCATTSLWAYLDAHPDVSMAAGKETNFFRFHHEQGPAFYEGRFDPAASVYGESCPEYTVRPYSEGTAERIAAMVPEARLVYLVRDPVERIVSHWRHLQARGQDPLPFHRTVAAPEFERSEYVLRSRYWWQLEPFLRTFPEDRVRIVVVDDLVADPEGTMRSLFEFAGVDPTVSVADALAARGNRSDDKRRPPALVRRVLLPGVSAVAPPPPPWRRNLVERFTARFGREIPKPIVGATERERIGELVGDDVRALAGHLGRPLWGY